MSVFLFPTLYSEADIISNYRKEELKGLISEYLRGPTDSYPIQQLFAQIPATAELMDVSEKQLKNIKGIGIGKAR
ncbi:hypothetical protein BK127_33665 [Paenibacillus sp. FSL H7-0331]|nr:hypothetical protein BK127_33665 [Paenibacillus sp. FSL H7-0331]